MTHDTRTAYMIRTESGIETGRVYLYKGIDENSGLAIADRIGEDEPALVRWKVQPGALIPATNEVNNPAQIPTIQSLCAEAVTKYRLDAGRVARAAEITIMGKFTPHTGGIILVQSSTGGKWYETEKGKCTCPDAERGHICKHRIAVWIVRELATRTRPEPVTLPDRIEYRRAYCENCNAYHWLEMPEGKCHGELFTPRETATHYKKWNAGSIWLIKKAPAEHTEHATPAELHWLEMRENAE